MKILITDVDFIHIDDLVDLHGALLKQLPQLDHSLNDHRPKVIFAAARSQEPHSVVADISAVRSALNWYPKRVGFRIFAVPGTQKAL